MKPAKTLIVDDDESILFAFREVLQKEGCICLEATDGKEAIEKCLAEQPDLIFMDITMPNVDGLEALRRIKEISPLTPVILITGYGTMQTAIRAIQLGAFEYLTKPLSVVKIREMMRRALVSVERTAVTSVGNVPLRSEAIEHHELVGDSASMQEVYKLIGSISTTPNHTSVLILGESGTGKELVARAIHNNSAHAQEPFVAINCTAFPETLLESELFGHEKGTFTGAGERKLGKFELAHRGSIFLDEIGDLSTGLQLKLLRVLQEREFERLGGNTRIDIEARFIAATNQDIMAKVKAGSFREDLYYRLNVVRIQLPALREHPEDVPLLAHFFLARYNHLLKKTIKGFADEAMALLLSYSYPGNVRELENVIERAVMLTKGDVVLPEAMSEIDISTSRQVQPDFAGGSFNQAREQVISSFEKQYITEQLARHRGNVSAAARASGMSRQNFHRLLIKHQIHSGEPEE